MKEFILIMLIVHLLGDFYFQSEKLSNQKKNRLSALFLHSAIYLLTALLSFIRYNFNLEVLLTGAIIGVCHFLIDLVFYFINKSNNNTQKTSLFFIADQLLHIAVILTVAKLFQHTFLSLNYQTFFGIDTEALKWIAAVLFVGKPANIAFKKIFYKYRPVLENAEDKPQGEEAEAKQYAGAVIGVLERILTLILIAVYAYAGIGLILTAKSIARYDKISKNSQFAEYYLIGTLSSILFTIGAYLAIFVLI